MPDNMLEDAIQISKRMIDEHDFESNGVEVSEEFDDMQRCKFRIFASVGETILRNFYN